MTKPLLLLPPTDKIHPLLAFRIVAWKACDFSYERWQLGPKFYCPTCVLPQKDISKGCPTCPLTILFNRSYKDAARQEIEDRGGIPEGYTLEGLMASHSMVAGILGDNEDKINPEWSVTFTDLARIVLQERAQFRYGNDWNDWKKMQAK